MRIERFLKYIDALNEWTGRIVSYAVLFIMLTFCYEVFMRYVLNRPTIWVLEINQYILCAYIALTGGYIMSHNGHVNVEMFYEKFSPKKKALINVCTSVCFYSVVVILLWKSGIMAWESWESKEESFSIVPFPLFPSKVMIPLGAFLLLLQGTAKLIREVVFLFGGDKPSHL